MVQNFVVDASVLIQAFVRDQDTARVRTILRGAFDPDNPTVLYDSLYLALAEALSYPLITVDQRQSQVAAVVGIPLKPVAGFAPYSGGMA